MEDKNNWVYKKIYEITTHHFHKWYGLLSAILLLVFISLSIYRLIPEGEVNFIWYTIGVSVIGVFLVIGWAFYVWRYPKRSHKHLGVAIAIQAEELEDCKFFKKDFLAPFRSKIHDLSLPFDTLVLKNHQAEKVETVDDARRVLKKTRAHFCIWGSIKKRENVPAGEKYLFSLRGIVVHKPIQEVQKVLLRREFDSLLPYTLIFEKGLQFEAFEFRANQAVAALDYITGRAALLSGDFNTAINLHEALLNAIEGGQSYPISRDILKRLLAIEYEKKATFEFYINKVKDAYRESVNRSLRYDPNNYGALLKKAIIEFDDGNGDAGIALNTINKAKKRANGYHWLFSKAFLHFWLGQYDDALRACEKLKEKSYAGEEFTVSEVIQFNENLLKSQNKPQLYYWLGFVSYVKSKNLPSADKYFQEFVGQADSSMKNLKVRAKSYLEAIKNEIGY